MKNWKKLVSLILAIATMLSLVACGNTTDDSATTDDTSSAEVVVDENGIPEGLTLLTTEDGSTPYDAKYTGYNGGSYEITLGHGSAEESKVNTAAKYFANNLLIRSNGKIVVNLFPANQLGDDREQAESTALGNMDASFIGTGVTAGFLPALNFGNMPWIFQDLESFGEFYDGEGGQYLAEEFAKNVNMVIGGWGALGWRQQICSTKQLKTPADMKGIKTRCQQNTIHTAIFNGIGAVAVPMAAVEVYTGLQQGTIQGMDQVLYAGREKRHDEVAPYWTILNWGQDPLLLLMNKDTLNNFDEEARAIVEEEMVKWGIYDRSIAEDWDAKAMEEMKAGGVQFYYPTEEELQQWKDEMRAVAYPTFQEMVGDEIYNKLMSMCDTNW